MKYTVLFFLLMFSFTESKAQKIKNKKPSIWQDVIQDGGDLLGGVKYAFTRPLYWEKDDWLKAGAFVGGTALLYLVDEDTTRFFRDQKENAPGVIKEIGWYYGSPQNFFMISGGIYGYGLLAKNEKFRETGVLIITSAVATGLIQSITKNAFGRARPTENVGSDKFKPFSKLGAYHSFPSGHTILSMTASHAIAKQFSNPWLKGGIYAVGLISPVSRLWEGAHWLTDVTFGIVISILVVDSVDNFLQQKRKSRKEKVITWNVRAGINTIGLIGTF
ncbi:MAG: phosphoesterase [Flavobacteriaceae bacterium]|nr:MAG: phosphoesterase [Flavobacteriaceae bacterium]